MRYAVILALGCLGCAERPGAEDRALVAAIEARVHLPQGAGPLRCYRRYYRIVRGRELNALVGQRGPLPFDAMLVGTYREPDGGAGPGIRWVRRQADIPDLHDGGCLNMVVWHPVGSSMHDVRASCSLDYAGDTPDRIGGRPLTC